MTEVSKQLEKRLQSIIRKGPILPVKTDKGILVGDVLIVSDGPIKHIYQNDRLLYKEISLNVAAIAIANIIAKRQSHILADKIYNEDHEYGKWYQDSQHLRSMYQKAVDSGSHSRADIFWARYVESRERAVAAKNRAQTLSRIE